MAAEYQLLVTSPGTPQIVLRVADGAFVPDDPANRDWLAYQAWLDLGNFPDPAPSPGTTSPMAMVIAQSAQALALSQARSLNAQGRTQEAVAAILDYMEQHT